jgi:hypothetical protein
MPVDLVFKATDSDGTTVAIRRVTVAFPAC